MYVSLQSFKLFFFFGALYFCGTGVWAEGLTLARQVLYHFSHPSILFAWVLYLCLGHPGQQSYYLHFSCSWDYSCVPPHPGLLIEMGSCYHFAQTWNTILPISASQLTRITGMCHRTDQELYIFYEVFSRFFHGFFLAILGFEFQVFCLLGMLPI
jgi:hypothetical protein